MIVTLDAKVSGEMWLIRDYTPEVAELDRRIFPSIELLASWLGGTVRVSTEVVERVVAAVSRDLETGLWDQRHGHLREIDECDAGLRPVGAHPGTP